MSVCQILFPCCMRLTAAAFVGGWIADNILPRIPALERWRKSIQGDD